MDRFGFRHLVVQVKKHKRFYVYFYKYVYKTMLGLYFLDNSRNNKLIKAEKELKFIRLAVNPPTRIWLSNLSHDITRLVALKLSQFYEYYIFTFVILNLNE